MRYFRREQRMSDKWMHGRSASAWASLLVRWRQRKIDQIRQDAARCETKGEARLKVVR